MKEKKLFLNYHYLPRKKKEELSCYCCTLLNYITLEIYSSYALIKELNICNIKHRFEKVICSVIDFDFFSFPACIRGSHIPTL